MGPGEAPSERGAAAVEFALLALLLFMLIFGSITAGLSFSRSNGLQTAAREGARFGATLPGAAAANQTDSATTTWYNRVIDTTRAAGLGDLDDGVPGRTICAAFYDGSSWKRRVLTATTCTYTHDTSECFSDGLGSEPRVQVTARRDSEIQAVAFSIDITVGGDGVSRYER